jgi:hypothetical protein
MKYIRSNLSYTNSIETEEYNVNKNDQNTHDLVLRLYKKYIYTIYKIYNKLYKII